MELDELRRLSEAADEGPWTFRDGRLRSKSRAIADVRYANNRANVDLIVAAVEYVRDLLRSQDPSS